VIPRSEDSQIGTSFISSEGKLAEEPNSVRKATLQKSTLLIPSGDESKKPCPDKRTQLVV
jgi:hypothetical protein